MWECTASIWKCYSVSWVKVYLMATMRSTEGYYLEKILPAATCCSFSLSRYSPTETALYVQNLPCVTSVWNTHFPFSMTTQPLHKCLMNYTFYTTIHLKHFCFCRWRQWAHLGALVWRDNFTNQRQSCSPTPSTTTTPGDLSQTEESQQTESEREWKHFSRP